MKKGLKKFLGVAMVAGISASASAIGSNYCGANAVYAAKPPEMTEPWMKNNEKYWSSLEGVWKDVEFDHVKADEEKFKLRGRFIHKSWFKFWEPTRWRSDTLLDC